MLMKTKLLIITRWYLPAVKSGGTVRSIVALVNGLKDSFDITILTSNRDLGAKKPYEDVEFDKFTLFDGVSIIYMSELKSANIYKYINIINPDIIYVNSFFDVTTRAIMFLKKLRKINSKIVLAPRGELANGALSIKSIRKKIYILFYKLFDFSKGITFHATSKEELLDIKKFFPINRIKIIQNPKDKMRGVYTLPVKEENILKIVFISRIAPVKNLHYALKILKEYKFIGFIEFDIYGPDEDISYWNECQQIINDLDKNIKVFYKGFVEPDNIGMVLSKYHLFFLPTKGENFGHAIIEAMSVGLIPLISDKTPWQNLSKFNIGYSLSLSDKSSFYKAISDVLLLNNKQFLEKSNNIKKYISEKVDNQRTISEYKLFFIHKKKEVKYEY